MDIQMTEALKKALDGNEELLSEVSGYETTATTNADRVQGLERDIKTAVDKRQALKDLIRKTTGLSELTEENLSKLGSGDEALKSEVLSLQDKLGLAISERDGLNNQHKGEINSMRMMDMLRSMGVDKETLNTTTAFDAVAEKMLKGAEYTEDGFRYVEEDGATVFGQGGKALTVNERLSQLREDKDVYQFAKPTGGGASSSGKPTQTKSSGMSDHEIGLYIAKNGAMPPKQA